ncbi:metallophosphoesterase family protein [Proteiniborus sp. MB09-C3]|uniref:metallophosphoesterase family protein n=1 Tax=Proteiniborus sp. MB09-C3 TaxID=3050072 RepID=UPI002556C2E9|nr:metallophosphoesterase family protein [Proteiniborus sp. MB09-C3]WIV11485.1 metallophosphoesterase family protein [Proteiniborus sp. MB09-C3]
MDKVAVISDIHGNIPALRAVLDDIREKKIERIICLGDLAGKGPNPAEAVDIVRAECTEVLMGNWDMMISKENDYEMVVWAREKLGEERLDYISKLPFSVDFYISGRLTRLFHASPQGVFHRVHSHSPSEKLLGMFDNTENTGNTFGEQRPDIIGYGDIHGAYIRYFDNKVIFNVGSVGNPLDITLASYVILEGEYSGRDNKGFQINFVRVPYDVELAVKLAKESNMPEIDSYINELRTGRYRGRK